jgi:hypothetical protein
MTVAFGMKANMNNIMFAAFTLLLRSGTAFFFNRLHPAFYMYVWQIKRTGMRHDVI